MISLFAGLGFLERGLLDLGARVALYAEKNDKLRAFLDATYRRITHATAVGLDYVAIPAADTVRENLVALLGKLGKSIVTATILFAGFPCQDVSFMGPGEGEFGSRSGLWTDVLLWLDLVPTSKFLDPRPSTLARALKKLPPFRAPDFRYYSSKFTPL